MVFCNSGKVCVEVVNAIRENKKRVCVGLHSGMQVRERLLAMKQYAGPLTEASADTLVLESFTCKSFFRYPTTGHHKHTDPFHYSMHPLLPSSCYGITLVLLWY